MGASGWRYLVEYQDDHAAALAELRATVCAAGDFYWTTYEASPPKPTTLDDPVWQEEDVWEEGTHSILDIDEVAPPDSDGVLYGQTILVSAGHAQIVFGTERPTVADIERVGGPFEASMEQLLPARGIGRHLVVYTDDAPSHLLFWGFSGD
jgi:hypothetical protein